MGTTEHRIRNDLPLITTDCSCPSCGHSLPFYHQLPLASFLFLGGKCHFCHERISFRYPILEGGTALFYGIIFLLFQHTPPIYLLLWYISVSILLLARCRRHYRSLGKGLCIMAFYHIVISVLYLVLYQAVLISSV
ncbi:MAG: prepilin peptidase [Acetatifactor sp.]|nr:prepilin peptidase [Acetatifactor sp.]